MKKNTIKINENTLRQIVAESVKSALKELRDPKDYYLQDALEAIDMADGCIDFEEWYPAFYDDLDAKEAEEIFNKAMGLYQGNRNLEESVKRAVKKVLNERRGRNPYGYMDFDQDAYDKWENETHIPQEVMEMVNHVAEKIGMGSVEETVVHMTNRWGETIGYGKGISLTHCTSSYADGPSTDYSSVFAKWCKGLGFEECDSHGDNGMDSATNWHDTYWTHEFVYEGTEIYNHDLEHFVPYDENDEDAYAEYLDYEDESMYDDDDDYGY